MAHLKAYLMGWITKEHHAILVWVVGRATFTTICPETTSTEFAILGKRDNLLEDVMIELVLMCCRRRWIILVLKIIRFTPSIACLCISNVNDMMVSRIP